MKTTMSMSLIIVTIITGMTLMMAKMMITIVDD